MHNAGIRRHVWRQGRCEEVNASLSVNSGGLRPRLGDCECSMGRGKGIWGSDYKVPSTMLECLDLILKAIVTP